ncbi:MAG: pyridoxal 5'-phosphate synthase glutaminase subunit PdxT [Candidatus Marinimicrobia bacterium]|nr:pyridoxal 5'-phosphate synthase glutaminase subunit PdxT [Candidatus Neomarinimicrobiota bacterium]
MKIGILALQGDYEKHTGILDELGLDSILVRYPFELIDIEGLIIPGGESTTLTHLMKRMNFYKAMTDFANEKPILGTCAGLIMMAKVVNHHLVKPLGLLDIEVDRNGYGRQIHSFTENLPVQLNNHIEKIPVTFIRAPKITKTGEGVEILAEYHGEICAVKQGKHIGLAFHPELDGVSIFHKSAFIPNSISSNKEKPHAA